MWKQTRKYSSLFTKPSGIPINREVSGGEEFTAALHPLFTTLHLYTFLRIRLKREDYSWINTVRAKTTRRFKHCQEYCKNQR